MTYKVGGNHTVPVSRVSGSPQLMSHPKGQIDASSITLRPHIAEPKGEAVTGLKLSIKLKMHRE